MKRDPYLAGINCQQARSHGRAAIARLVAMMTMVAGSVAASAAGGADAQGVVPAERTGPREILPAPAPELNVKFSCSAENPEDRLRDGDRRLYADSGAFHLRGNSIVAFYWESSLFRSSHGADCSIDESDGLVADLLPPEVASAQRWRISLSDGRAARTRRGYDADHGVNCSIRITHVGGQLQIVPSCPALCGSRENFSRLNVDLQTGNCTYEH